MSPANRGAQELERLYSLCEYEQITVLASDNREAITPLEVDIQGFYKGEIPKEHVLTSVYEHTANELNTAYEKGYEKKFFAADWTIKDNELLNRVQNNIFAFSAAKSFTQANELRNAVYDSKGNIVPENTFRRAVAKISTKYNKQYLQAERHQVMAAGTQGSRWIDIQESKDTHPFLEYVTARDERVREEHRALDGIILPIDDPFWERYYPPNGWRCRCATRKLSDREAEHKNEVYKGKEKMEMPNSETAQKMAGKVVAKPFRHNVGTTEIFERDGHPYFKANKEAKEMQLSAVKNYGMKKVEEIYNHPSRLAAYKGELKSKEEYNDWWAAQEQKHGKEGEGFTLVDRKNKIAATFDTKLKLKLRDDKERWCYGDEMTEVFFKPDEVWGAKVGGQKQNFDSELFNVYIKYYEDVPVVLLINQIGRVDSFYKLNKISQVEQFRLGLLKQKR